MHDEIIRYHMEGEVSEVSLPESRERLILFLENQMRDEGVAPTLDMDPQFTVDYDPGRELFNFQLSIYGTYVGSNACEVAGVMAGKTILKHTLPTKSKGLSDTAA